MEPEMLVNGQKAKKKTRRKKQSKCEPTSAVAIEGTPFKNGPTLGMSVTLSHNYAHIFDHVSVNGVQATELTNNVLNVQVGVKMSSLLNEDLVSAINLEYLATELEKMRKKHNRLNVYINVALKQVAVIFPGEDCTERFSQKAAFHILYFIILHVVPSTLLGSISNLKVLMKSAKRIVYGSLHQSFSLSSLVQGLKVSHIPWLQKALPSNSLRLHVLACLSKWLHLYVQVILKRTFHLAVNSSTDIVYYHRSKWFQIQRAEMNAIVSSGKIKNIENDGEEMEKITHFGRTGFLVKTHGLRPITRFRKPSQSEILLMKQARLLLSQLAHQTGSMNTFLSPCFDEVLQENLLRIRNCYPNSSSRPIYYFVRADVKDAYGSINQLKMLSILKDMHENLLPKYCTMQLCTVKFGSKIKEMFESDRVTLSEKFTKLNSKTVNIKPILTYIRGQVHRVGTVIGNQPYRICHGIPQGMNLSSILCEIYYNALDISHLKEFKQIGKDEVFLRYCDDYLFLTPSKVRAEQFIQKLSSGIRDFDVYFNPKKTLTNVETGIDSVVFYGYDINLATFCVQSNFKSYENQNMASFQNLRGTEKLGKVLLRRTKIILKLKPILLDRRLNSKHVVAQNIYFAALFAAFRICAFINCSFPVMKTNEKHVLRCVKESEKNLRKTALCGISKSCKGKWLVHDEIKWIVYQAFHTRMCRNGSRYSKVLKYLKATCHALLTKMQPCQVQLLKWVSNPRLPGVFATMK